MNKKFKFLLVGIISVTLLVGCNDSNNTDSSTDEVSSNVESSSQIQDSLSESESTDSLIPSEESSSVEDSSTAESTVPSDTPIEAPDEYNELPNWTVTSRGISYSGDLIDVMAGVPFMTGADYTGSYTLSTSLPESTYETVVSSNENVFTVEVVGTTLNIKAVHAGQAYLRITDSNGIHRLCQKIVVKDAIPLDYMEEYLVYDCEYWVTIYGESYTLTFNEGGVYTLSGSISNQAFAPITGTYEYVATINNNKEYQYKFTDDDIAAIGLVGFNILATGKFMYIQHDGGTDAILWPINEIE